MGIVEDSIRRLFQRKPQTPISPPPITRPTAGLVDPPWLAAARRDIGIHEGIGAANNPRVIEMFAKAGHLEVKQDSVAWCAAAVGCWLAEGGIKGTGTLWALDYRKWGQPLPGPALGAVAVRERKGGGHVGFVAGWDAGAIYLLAGNQSDQVKIAAYDRRTAGFAFRWPAGMALPAHVPAALTVANATAASSEA